MSTERTQEIEQIASEWLVRRDSGDWTASDQSRFDEWLNASTLHQVAFLRLELGWEDAQRLKALGAGIDSIDPPPPGHWNLTPFFDQASAGRVPVVSIDGRARRNRRLLALAASLVITLAIFWQLRSMGNAYETPVGGTSAVPVPDGSKVTLNTDSQIRVSFTDAERRIELEQGEAFFEVVKDSKRPFVVTAGNRRVVAVGTQFSVRRNANDVRVVVTEGKVRIEDPASLTDPVLGAGSVARASDAGVWVESKTIPEAEEQLSWRNGVLMFRNQTLADAIVEFNRYNTRKFAIDDPTIGNLKIEGNFRATNIDAFARLLEEVYPVSVSRQGEGRLLIEPR
jgi:transmembrane sensor